MCLIHHQLENGVVTIARFKTYETWGTVTIPYNYHIFSDCQIDIQLNYSKLLVHFKTWRIKYFIESIINYC